jgi:hypothetical protein
MALQRLYPHLLRVSVNKKQIKFTDPDRGRRYYFPTPEVAGTWLVHYDTTAVAAEQSDLTFDLDDRHADWETYTPGAARQTHRQAVQKRRAKEALQPTPNGDTPTESAEPVERAPRKPRRWARDGEGNAVLVELAD